MDTETQDIDGLGETDLVPTEDCNAPSAALAPTRRKLIESMNVAPHCAERAATRCDVSGSGPDCV